MNDFNREDKAYEWTFWLLVLGLLLIFAFGCKSKQATTEYFYSDTTTITEKIKLVPVPGVSLKSNPINIDSLVAKIKAGIPLSVIEKETIYQDPKTGDRIGILIDQFGNLTALCEVQERMIEMLEREITNLKSRAEKTTVVVKPNFFQRLKSSMDLILYTALIVLVISFIIPRFLRV